jgi:hypothetical protein
MQVKSNIRAGKGGASGVGKNSKGLGYDIPDTPEVEVEPAPVYYPPVARCAGI